MMVRCWLVEDDVLRMNRHRPCRMRCVTVAENEKSWRERIA